MLKKLLFVIGSGVVLASVSLVISAGVASASTSVSESAVSSGIAATTPAGVAGPVSPAVPACPAFGRSLSIGASGNDVTALQAYLDAQGYLSVSPTGYFGPLTQAAVASWQAQGGVVAQGDSGSGIFGPLSRAYFSRSCGTISGVGSGNGSGSGGGTTQGAVSFSVAPNMGIAPLSVQFVASAPQGSTIGNSVTFGDGTSGSLAFVPVCSNCNAMATVSHVYAATGTYVATLISGACACPANGACNCPNLMILATTTITVMASDNSASGTTAGGIEQLDEPGTVALATGGIAEVRNANFYFTLASTTASTATIDITPVGCWNSFPSDPIPAIRCMIAVVPTPPQTLSVGQEYEFGNYGITLTSLTGGTATFSIQ